MSVEHYQGTELELFRDARNWKAYLAQRLRPLLGPRVLEVGSGIGGTTAVLCGAGQSDWLCLEPDPALADLTRIAIAAGELPSCCRVAVGTLGDLPEEPIFDTILYIDVLEHIEEDAAELDRAARRLAPGGDLVVLAPAHAFLFSPFDEAVGHYRRYTARSLANITPEGLRIETSEYLDCVGMIASIANRMLLRQSQPNAAQIGTWDRFMVPLSRLLDPILGRRFGRSVLTTWRRP